MNGLAVALLIGVALFAVFADFKDAEAWRIAQRLERGED